MRGVKRLFCLSASILLASLAPAQAAPVAIKAAAAKPLPALSYTDAKGSKQAVDASKAKLTVLHFWATWCVPCIKELPELDAFAKAYAGRVQVLPLALDGADISRITMFYKQHKISTLTANYDADNAALMAVKGSVLPLSVFIDPKGQEIARASGAVEWDGADTLAFVEKAIRAK